MRRIHWRLCYRLIYTRAPSIDLFERLSDEKDWADLQALTDLHNPRVRQAPGDLLGLEPKDVVTGPGSAYLMAPFAYPNPYGSRFSDGRWGVYYAAGHEATAIAEVKYHRTQFMRATAQGPTVLEMHLIGAELKASLHDIRAMTQELSAVYNPEDYSASQALGYELYQENSWGVVYQSVRHSGGRCVAVFRPKALRQARAIKYLYLRWNGQDFTDVLERSVWSG